MNISHPSQRGFTLLELLAAIVVLSIGFTVLLNTLGHATQALARDKQVTQMALAAESIIDEHAEALSPIALLEGTLDGMQWRLTATPLAGNDSIALSRLELLLQVGSRQERFVTLRAFGRPAGLAQ
ncbi:type IV pilus modification PilV family protein [Pseudomonas edaphica]|uniref:type IV pilus modification PilV family protein n=1 Tax=Pseudomonas edaphica TaxID=2006980 RepID=UPI001F0F2558|nr:type II secretion system protein [Pseudomonas edaphica]